MRAPRIERSAFLVGIIVTLINPNHTCTRTSSVTQDSFGHLERYL